MSQTHGIYGWLAEEEPMEALMALPGEDSWRNSVSGLFSMPKELNRRWLRTEMQSQIGSCQGCALSEVGEVCYHIATGEVTQFSKMAAYIWSQRVDGIQGDRGSTLNAGAKVATEIGFCTEDLWPYPRSYQTLPPGGGEQERKCKADAAKRKLNTIVRIASLDGLIEFLGAGLGTAWIGRTADWGGGHATHLAGFYNYGEEIDEHNSWDIDWGDKGWKKRTKADVKRWFQYRDTIILGASDMVDVKPREPDWLNKSPFFLGKR